MFFIVGSARSGTTLMRIVLNAHSEIAVPPESRFVVELYDGTDDVPVDPTLDAIAAHPRFKTWDLSIDAVRERLGGRSRAGYGEVMTAAYRAYAEARGKSRWGDKTPRYIERIPLLAKLFPEARFIQIVRDGRNVALSYADVPFGPKTVARAAALWANRVSTGMAAGRALGPRRYVEVLYEEFVTDPEPQLQAICDFIEAPFEPEMLEYHHRSREEVLGRAARYNPRVTEKPIAEVRSWAEQMPARQVEVFEAVAGDVLSQLGYPRRYPNPRPWARAAGQVGRIPWPRGLRRSLARRSR
jgi:hypothetical protein